MLTRPTSVLDRVFTPGLAQVAYLIADEAAGAAAVIDPRRDVAAYLDWARSRDLRITAIAVLRVDRGELGARRRRQHDYPG